MITIDYYMFTLSPFTYLAGDRLEKIADRYAAKINYKPFNLMQVFEKTGGTPPKDRHISRQIYRAQEIRRVADHNEMKVTEKPVYWPTNPTPSCYAIIAAQEAGGGDIGGLCQTILKSCWLEDKDIADDSILKDALTLNGFDKSLTDSGLLQGAEVFSRNTEDAVNANVFGSPSYVVGEQVFFGQDRLEYLDNYLSKIN
ncbi:2-hydroxychromene-2-carboxylate isomerase [Amylibacter sp.]|nr:2-hydroxychromene-2-carboxylate isomerase [Amylibacter sp.]